MTIASDSLPPLYPNLDREALAKQSLVIASLLEKLAPGSNAGPDEQRHQYITQLMAVAKFLKELGYPETADPFYKLALAIFDLDFGTTAAFLRTQTRSGKPSESSNLWFIRAQIALAIAANMRAGLKREQAAAAVQSFCRSIGKQKNFLTWYDDFNSQRVRNLIGVEAFEEGLRIINFVPESDGGILKEFAKKFSMAATHRFASH